MKAAIDMMPRKLPDGEYSHTGGWAFLRANQLKHVGIDVQVLSERGRGIDTDWSEFDVVYLYHTMDFNHKHAYMLNIFDGPQEHTAKFFERLIFPQHEKIKFISLDYPMPNYGYRCKWKKDRADESSKMSDYWKNVDWDKVQEKCDSIKDWVLDPGVILQSDGSVLHLHRKVVMGDSHAHSAYTPKSLVIRKDGRWMGGIIKKTIKAEIISHGFDYDQIDEITAYYGNIDIRHHICREPDPIQATKDLISKYAEMLKQNSGKKIEVVCALPIEDESRKLPATGMYKGTPFFGSRAQRIEVMKVFNNELKEHAAKNGWSVFQWPSHWYEMDGIEFMETIMERPRSVHLARKFYRWDLINDCLNVNHNSPGKKLLSFD